MALKIVSAILLMVTFSISLIVIIAACFIDPFTEQNPLKAIGLGIVLLFLWLTLGLFTISNCNNWFSSNWFYADKTMIQTNH